MRENKKEAGTKKKGLFDYPKNTKQIGFYSTAS